MNHCKDCKYFESTPSFYLTSVPKKYWWSLAQFDWVEDKERPDYKCYGFPGSPKQVGPERPACSIFMYNSTEIL